MALTAQDVANVTFKRGRRGYDTEEVDVFLEKIIDELNVLHQGLAEKTTKAELLAEQLQSYKTMEDAMKNAFVTAQRSAQNITNDAEERAKQTIVAAQERAAELHMFANTRLDAATQDAQDIVEDAQEKAKKIIALAESEAELRRAMILQVERRLNDLRLTWAAMIREQEELLRRYQEAQ